MQNQSEDVNAVRIVRTYEKLLNGRKNWDTYWEYAAQYALPNRSDFITKRIAGDMTRTDQLFDSTATRGARLLATSIIGAIFTGKWFSLKMRNNNDDDDARNKWLEDVQQIMLSAFEDSNFLVQVGQAVTGLVVYGTSGLSVEDVSDDGIFDTLMFRDHILSSFVFDEGADGLPNRTYREISMSAEAAYDKYKSNEDVPKDVIEHLAGLIEKSKGELSTVKFVESIEPSTLYGADEALGRYKGTLVYKELKLTVEEFYHNELPMLVSRWDKITGDIYGWSPTLGALPDIITINEAKRLELGAWEMSIKPAKEVMVGTLFNGEINRKPDGVTLVTRENSIKNLDDPYNFQITMVKSDEIRDSIKSAYHEQELILPDRNHDTATEVQIRYDLMQRLLGATFGRIKSELLQPIINRVFRIMMDGGAFPDFPAAEGDAKTEIDVEYQSPLAKSQRAAELQTIDRLVGMAVQLAQVKQDEPLLAAIDGYETMKAYNDALGVPAMVLKDRKTYNEAVEKMMEAAKKQQAEERAHEQNLSPNAETQETPPSEPIQ